MIASGVRLGTPAVTTRGMGREEMRRIAALILEAIDGNEEPARDASIRARVADLCRAFPLYPWLRRAPARAAGGTERTA